MTLAGWERRPFVEVVLADPELAACVLLSPGWWAVATPPEKLPEPERVAATVGEQIDTAMGAAAPASLSLLLAVADVKVPAAVAFGRTVLALLPASGDVAPTGLGPAVAGSLVAAASRPAAPDRRCGEPLLVLGETLAAAGAASLATLPAALRPVRDWLEPDDAEPPLRELVDAALDDSTPWPARRARTQAVARPDGAGQSLGHAAALLVEVFGDPAHARAVPFDLLRAWRENADGRFPSMPGKLKRAMGRPLEAGLQRNAAREEREALDLDILTRQLEDGVVPAQPPAGRVPLATRLLAAAIARSQGKGACAWIGTDVPAGLRTGCRAEGEADGFVYARPRPTGGAEVIARAATGEEGVLLRWPRWVLFPLVDSRRGELDFVDERGVQGVALDGHTPPRMVLAGTYRLLTLSPDGRHLAAVRWPSGMVVLVTSSGVRELTVDGRGGVAWLDNDVLVASDRERLVLASVEGDSRRLPVDAPCVRGLARSGVGLLATTAAPCEPALLSISPTEWKVERLLRLPDAAAGMVARPDGSVVFGGPAGLWRWKGGEESERIGAGLTPGPG